MTNTSDDQTLTIPDAVELEADTVPAPEDKKLSEKSTDTSPKDEVTEQALPEATSDLAQEMHEASDSSTELDTALDEALSMHINDDAAEDHKQDASERALRLITAIERDMRELRSLITGHEISYGAIGNSASSRKAQSYSQEEGVAAPSGFMSRNQSRGDEGIEGTFDGERMIDSNGKTYPVPPNYASKSKLVEGDPLKLYITPDGKFVFKQLGPIQRRSFNGVLIQDGTHYLVQTDEGQTYNILTACVTYHMALYGLVPGGRVQIMVPADRDTRWAVIDAVI